MQPRAVGQGKLSHWETHSKEEPDFTIKDGSSSDFNFGKFDLSMNSEEVLGKGHNNSEAKTGDAVFLDEKRSANFDQRRSIVKDIKNLRNIDTIIKMEEKNDINVMKIIDGINEKCIPIIFYQ